MTDPHFEVVQRRVVLGTLGLDGDLLLRRIAAGKAAYRLAPAQSTKDYETTLLKRMAFEERLISHALPENPMQAVKRKRTVLTRSLPVAMTYDDIPARLRFGTHKPGIRYDTKKLTPEAMAVVTEAVHAAGNPPPPVRAGERRREFLLDTIVRHSAQRYRPAINLRNDLSTVLAPYYDEAADVCEVDRTLPWSLRQPLTGLVIEIDGTLAAPKDAMAAYRKELVKAESDLIVVTETEKTELHISPYIAPSDGELTERDWELAGEQEIDGE